MSQSDGKPRNSFFRLFSGCIGGPYPATGSDLKITGGEGRESNPQLCYPASTVDKLPGFHSSFADPAGTSAGNDRPSEQGIPNLSCMSMEEGTSVNLEMVKRLISTGPSSVAAVLLVLKTDIHDQQLFQSLGKARALHAQECNRMEGVSRHTDVQAGLTLVHHNWAATQLLGVACPTECEEIVRRQISQNPSLNLSLRGLLRDLKDSKPASCTLYLPTSLCCISSQSAASQSPFVEVRISAAELEDEEDSTYSGVLLTYELPGGVRAGPCTTVDSRDMFHHHINSSQDSRPAAQPSIPAQPQDAFLLYQNVALSYTEHMITIFGHDGGVVFQNGMSRCHLGCVMGEGQGTDDFLTDQNGPPQEHLLRQIFYHDPSSLTSMWSTLQAGQSWVGLVKFSTGMLKDTASGPLMSPLDSTPLALPSSLSGRNSPLTGISSSLLGGEGGVQAVQGFHASESVPSNLMSFRNGQNTTPAAGLLSNLLKTQDKGRLSRKSTSHNLRQVAEGSMSGQTPVEDSLPMLDTWSLKPSPYSISGVLSTDGTSSRSFNPWPEDSQVNTPDTNPTPPMSTPRVIMHVSEHYSNLTQQASGGMRAVRLLSGSKNDLLALNSPAARRASRPPSKFQTLSNSSTSFLKSPSRSYSKSCSTINQLSNKSSILMRGALDSSKQVAFERLSTAGDLDAGQTPWHDSWAPSKGPNPLERQSLREGGASFLFSPPRNQHSWIPHASIVDKKPSPIAVGNASSTLDFPILAAKDTCWHEITAHVIQDPVTGHSALLISQSDVTSTVQAHLKMTQVLDVEHRLLEQIFPRHVLESVAAKSASPRWINTMLLQNQLPNRKTPGEGTRLSRQLVSPDASLEHAEGRRHSSRPDLGYMSQTAPLFKLGRNLKRSSVGCLGIEESEGHEEQLSPLKLGIHTPATSAPLGSHLLKAKDAGSNTDTLALLGGASGSSTPSSVLVAVGHEVQSSNASSVGNVSHVQLKTPINNYANVQNCASFGPWNDDVLDDFKAINSGSLSLSLTLTPESKTSSAPVGASSRMIKSSAEALSGHVLLGDASLPELHDPQLDPLREGTSSRCLSENDSENGAWSMCQGQGTRQMSSEISTLEGSNSAVSLALEEQCSGNFGSGIVPHEVARDHEAVTILFADIVGFTDMCGKVPSTAVMAFLNNLFSKFDAVMDVHDLYKVETIGDCYMVAGGLLGTDEDGSKTVIVDPDHATKVFAAAVNMLEVATQVALPSDGSSVQLRIGLHSGPVSSGIVGQQMPRFCLFGDTVNTASRMESNSLPGHINCSDATLAAMAELPQYADGWLPHREINVKGKGLMNTRLWSWRRFNGLDRNSGSSTGVEFDAS